MASHDGSVALVANGELYACADTLRDEAYERGRKLRSESDSEALLEGYLARGPAVFAQLDGEYAIALYDQRERALYALRDPFGIKPLCVAVIDGATVFASEPAALLALGHRAAWDREALATSLWFQYTPPDRTLLDGVRQVEPGALWKVSRTETLRETLLPDAGFDEAARREPYRDRDEATRELRVAFERAVARRMRGDAPLAALLSGGLDSSAVVAAMRALGHDVTAFTLAFDDPRWDERDEARAFAARVGARWECVEVSRVAMVEGVDDAVRGPLATAINGHLSAKHALFKVIRAHGFKGALAGEGADEVFFGYPHLLQDAGLSGELQAFVTSAGTMIAPDAGASGDARLAGVGRAWGGVPSWVRAKVAMSEALVAIAPDAAGPMERAVDALAAAMSPAQTEGLAPIELGARSWSRFCLANYILRTLGDGTEMAHAIEGRLPMLDRDLVRAARRAPASWHVRDGVEKSLLREALRPLVGDLVADRRKKPLLAPPVAADPAALSLARERLRASDGAPSWADPTRLRAFLDAIDPERAGPREDAALFTLLTAAAIERATRGTP